MKTSFASISPSDKAMHIAFLLMHCTVFLAFFVPFSWSLVGLAIAMYYLRMFGITAGYHRYFAHRAYKTSRPMQFILALLGVLAAQKGPLWWAGHHRTHHQHSGTDQDIHAPEKKGLWWAHMGWVLSSEYNETPLHKIKDYAAYPEIRWLERNYIWCVIAFAVLIFALGGFPALVWGFFISTVMLYHGTFTINSLSHRFGTRRFDTIDDSRNNWFLSILTLGEGWHNNHHYYQHSASQGLRWWEFDISFYIIKFMEALGLVWGVKSYPEAMKETHKVRDPLALGKKVTA